MAIELIFETHSRTVDSELGRATGWLPGQLSEQGRAQAQQLGRRRLDDGITAVFSSDLARAAQTASAAFGTSAIPMLYDWRLRECDYGQRNGMPVAELHAGRREHLDQPYLRRRKLAAGSQARRPFLTDLQLRWNGSGSSSSATSPPDGPWTTSSAVSLGKTSLNRTSPGRKDGSTRSASQTGPQPAPRPAQNYRLTI